VNTVQRKIRNWFS